MFGDGIEAVQCAGSGWADSAVPFLRAMGCDARALFSPPHGETSSSSSRDGWMSAGVVLTSPAAERY